MHADAIKMLELELYKDKRHIEIANVTPMLITSNEVQGDLAHCCVKRRTITIPSVAQDNHKSDYKVISGEIYSYFSNS